jgi:hypothetical protein
MHCKKTYEQKDFSLAIDAETQSSNKEENEKIFFSFFFIYILIKQQRENTDKPKTKKKQNSGLKRRSQRIRAKTHNGNQESIDSYACLKTIKQKIFFFIFSINYQLRKSRLRVRGPNLLTVQP